MSIGITQERAGLHEEMFNRKRELDTGLASAPQHF